MFPIKWFLIYLFYFIYVLAMFFICGEALISVQHMACLLKHYFIKPTNVFVEFMEHAACSLNFF